MIAMLGPTLLALARQTGGSLAQLSFVFTTRSMGYLVGSIISGSLCDILAARAANEAAEYHRKAALLDSAPEAATAVAREQITDDGRGAPIGARYDVDVESKTAWMESSEESSHANSDEGVNTGNRGRLSPPAARASLWQRMMRPFVARANVSGLIAIMLTANALSAVLVPLMSTVAGLASVVVLQGLAMGLLDTAGNLMLLSLWGPKQSGPYLQALHCLFGVGTFVAPLLARSLVTGNGALDDGDIVCGRNATSVGQTTPAWMPQTSSTTMSPTPAPHVIAASVRGAYWSAAGLMLPVILGFVWLSRYEGMALRAPGARHAAAKATEDVDNHASGPPLSPTRRRVLLGLGFIFFAIYVGLEVSFGGYIFTYVTTACALRFSESASALITSAYWGSFALGRMAAIFLAIRIPPRTLVLGDLALCVSAALAMASFPENPTVLWFGASAFGLGMASVFPSGFHYLEQRLTLTGSSASLMVVGSALGEMAVPLSVGMAFDHIGPQTFLPINAGLAVGASAVFLSLLIAAGCSTSGRGQSYVRLTGSDETELGNIALHEIAPRALELQDGIDDDDEDDEEDIIVGETEA